MLNTPAPISQLLMSKDGFVKNADGSPPSPNPNPPNPVPWYTQAGLGLQRSQVIGRDRYNIYNFSRNPKAFIDLFKSDDDTEELVKSLQQTIQTGEGYPIRIVVGNETKELTPVLYGKDIVFVEKSTGAVSAKDYALSLLGGSNVGGSDAARAAHQILGPTTGRVSSRVMPFPAHMPHYDYSQQHGYYPPGPYIPGWFPAQYNPQQFYAPPGMMLWPNLAAQGVDPAQLFMANNPYFHLQGYPGYFGYGY